MSVEGRDFIAKSIGDLDSALSRARRDRLRIGLVPTLGALHDGHFANIRKAAAESDVVVVSIFLNRLQFDDPKDLARYPGDVTTDASSATRAGADVVFAPSDLEMYPNGAPEVVVDPGPKGQVLEGASRPGHFRGVATAVTKLFSIVRPHTAYFGEKDYQQLVIVRQLVKDLSIPVTVASCPTVRDGTGLAMSSRNVFLGASELAGAASLYRSLCESRDEIERGERDPGKIMKTMAHVIAEAPLLELEYAHVVREGTLDDVEEIDTDVRLLLAARIGDVRLIDNLLACPGAAG
jgi:pantoate--beta-alanine ligase